MACALDFGKTVMQSSKVVGLNQVSIPPAMLGCLTDCTGSTILFAATHVCKFVQMIIFDIHHCMCQAVQLGSQLMACALDFGKIGKQSSKVLGLNPVCPACHLGRCQVDHQAQRFFLLNEGTL
ncbi:unnamed protein product [Effrenium voratum]|uniref:Uncharacterized protein n=1 Tax=Effrenium voratum TaxID=2562239 RepID=A0AA36MSE3_9DINO|nr:unnamed protein product [Effrenium voratum]